MRTEAEVSVMQPQAKECGQRLGGEKAGEWTLPERLPRVALKKAPCGHLAFRL